jgi:hypothetical protein
MDQRMVVIDALWAGLLDGITQPDSEGIGHGG